MNSVWLGGAATIILAAMGALAPLPTEWVTLLLIASAVMVLERFAVGLNSENRFSPATAVYVGGALLPGVGVGLIGLLLLLETVARRRGRFFDALAVRTPEVLSLLVIALCRVFEPEAWWLPVVAAPLVLTSLTFYQASSAGRHLRGQERLEWLRVRLRLRPLESILGVSTLIVAGLMTTSPWLLIVLVPLLASTRYAAQTIVLLAKDASTAAILMELEDARGKSLKAQRDLARAKTEKQIMEAFAEHLAGNPDLQETCQQLLNTLKDLVKVDDIVIFLTPDPGTDSPVEPFLYRAQPAHERRLQGVALTRLQEPVVERCWKSKKPQEDTSLEDRETLLMDNAVGVALPLGEFGVLYAGRRERELFTAAEKKRIKWLSDKARLAFDAAFRTHNVKQQQAVQGEKLRALERRVTLLGNLINLAEAMASTLKLEDLADRLGRVLGGCLEGDCCLVHFQWDDNVEVKRAWGLDGGPDSLELLNKVRASGVPVNLSAFTAADPPPPHHGIKSVICAPLSAHEKTCGAVLLGSRKEGAFNKEASEQLRLMAYQAGMAFSNARLYHQVVLARKQLEESQQTLIQQSKMSAIGKLAAGVAHELNTPLGVINLSLEEAKDNLEEFPAMSKRMIDKALKAVQRSRTITDSMLAHSRTHTGEEAPIQVDESIRETLAFLSFEIKKALIRLSTDLQPITLVGRPQEFHQIMVNLIVNSVHAMENVPEDRRRLGIRAVKGPSGYVVEVQDTGIGMTPEQRERAFEPFYTTKDVGKGTGLGLWVSLQFVEKLGGTMEIETEHNKGTTVRVLIPLKK